VRKLRTRACTCAHNFVRDSEMSGKHRIQVADELRAFGLVQDRRMHMGRVLRSMSSNTKSRERIAFRVRSNFAGAPAANSKMHAFVIEAQAMCSTARNSHAELARWGNWAGRGCRRTTSGVLSLGWNWQGGWMVAVVTAAVHAAAIALSPPSPARHAETAAALPQCAR
jgi:hypothetical protein